MDSIESASQLFVSSLCLQASTGNYVEEKVFIDVLGETSFAQLLSVFACFADITGKDIKDVVEPRSKGNLQKLILTMSKHKLLLLFACSVK